ncbi:MAG TPA: hypothetical protein VK506_03920, partial [Conexibacter sp.]|nr:hypothetical protein [Conexibacter sp.]
MNERELREALRRAPVDERARERSRRVVQAAYRELVPASSRRARPRRRWALVVAACVATTLVAVSVTRSPTDALGRWLRDAVGIDARDARPFFGEVPG